MQDWQCRKGESILVPSGPEEKQHLFSIIIDPVTVSGYGSKPLALLVCAVSIKPGIIIDDSCLLFPGDHPFIIHDSFIDYKFTRLEHKEHLEKCVNKGLFTVKEQCSSDLIKRIIEGALKSKRLSREYKNIIKNSLFL